MRSTIVFLTLLVFISCSTKMLTSYDSVLLQFSSDPKAEAVFATMAIQLKQTGGFDRVLALLNELVEDGRKQLHDANKLWRETEARCDVSTMKFNERQDFYATRAAHLAEAVLEATQEKGVSQASSEFMANASVVFKAFLEKEVARHDSDIAMITGVVQAHEEAITSCDAAIKAVQEWTEGTAFVQTALKKVTDAYLQVKSFHIFIPNSFVELAANDQQVRQRLLEWLSSLRLVILDAKSTFEKDLKDGEAFWDSIEVAVEDLLAVYTGDAVFATAQIQTFEDAITMNDTSKALFDQLVSKNSALVTANAEYCGVEQNNYVAAKALMEEQLAMFRDIRTYFKDHYADINKFIKEKYASTPESA